MKKIRIKRTVDVAVNDIRNSIIDGTFPENKPLPAERTLAKEMGINRLTLRSALARLEAEGLVMPKHGLGVIVLNPWQHGSLDLMAHINDSEALSELFALRRNLAAEAVALATEKGSAKDISKLRHIAKRQFSISSDQRFLAGDLDFTRMMVKMGDSLALTLLFNSFERITKAQPAIPIRMLKDKKAACSSYMALIALIRNRDPELSRKAVMGHLNNKEEERFQRALSAD